MIYCDNATSFLSKELGASRTVQDIAYTVCNLLKDPGHLPPGIVSFQEGLAPITQRTYKAAMPTAPYMYNVTSPFPFSKHTLCTYISCLPDIASQTIKSNLSALSWQILLLNCSDPRDSSSFPTPC